MWDFGNGVKSNLPNPQVSFNTSGTFEVRLIAVYENTTAEIKRNIVIKPTTPVNLTSNKYEYCNPTSVQFNANTTQASAMYEWDFGDNTPIQTSNAPSNTHAYSNYGEYVAKVTITNSNGCKRSDTKLIKIKQPQITGSHTISAGCVPINNVFRTNITLPSSSSIRNYEWNFGDGQILNNQNATIGHTFNQPGIFIPQVTVSTNDGCATTFTFDTVKYGIPPTNLHAYPTQTRFCASEKAKFVATATNANSYLWNFGNGNIISTLDTSIEHKFSSLGYKTINIIPKYNGCAGQARNIVIQTIGAVSRFSFQNTCSNKNTFEFNNASVGSNLSYNWDFGHSSARSTATNNIHTFPTSGSFLVKLIAKDSISGCADTTSISVYTAKPLLINPSNTICINTLTKFKIFGDYPNPNANYQWNVMQQTIGPVSDSAMIIRADTLGNFTFNSVIIDNGPSYCLDTIILNHPILVRGPKLDFQIEDNDVCISTPVQLLNHSNPFSPSDSILQYQWNYGPQQSTINSTQPAPYTFTESGSFPIRLSAIDIHGCKDSLVKMVNIRPMPFIWIIPRTPQLCQGERDTMIAYTSDRIIWQSNLPLGNAFCNNCDTNLIQPPHSTIYRATVSNAFNCVTTDSIFVNVHEPFLASISAAKESICDGDAITLQANPSNKKIIWSPVSQLNGNQIPNPVVHPNQTTTYQAVLTDSANCFTNTTEFTVRVNPKPVIELGENKIVPYNTLYTASPEFSNNIRQFFWSSTATLNCNICPNPQITVTKLENMSVRVVSDSGCSSTDQIVLSTECNNAYFTMPTAFTPNNDQKNDIFYPMAQGIKHIKRFTIFNRNGQPVYEQSNFSPNDKSFGWDGKLNGAGQMTGTYIYIIEAVCDLNLSTIKKGTVVLIR